MEYIPSNFGEVHRSYHVSGAPAAIIGLVFLLAVVFVLWKAFHKR